MPGSYYSYSYVSGSGLEDEPSDSPTAVWTLIGGLKHFLSLSY